IGNNGAGKTTLFYVIAGLLNPSSGGVWWEEKLLQPGCWRPEMGLVLQNPDDQLLADSVWEDVAFGLRRLGMCGQPLQERVRQALERVGCQALANRPPHHLSGGEKRLVTLAGILAMQPQLILYDEPSATLDRRSRQRLIRLLPECSPTFLLASHDLDLIREVCQRVILLDQGQICADGPTHDILGDPGLLRRYELD
ncbi:MAG: ABC transporter ATP-binding protein, partial [Thermostichales cyanobacterium DRC_bins_46]